MTKNSTNTLIMKLLVKEFLNRPPGILRIGLLSPFFGCLVDLVIDLAHYIIKMLVL